MPGTESHVSATGFREFNNGHRVFPYRYRSVADRDCLLQQPPGGRTSRRATGAPTPTRETTAQQRTNQNQRHTRPTPGRGGERGEGGVARGGREGWREGGGRGGERGEGGVARGGREGWREGGGRGGERGEGGVARGGR